MIHYTALTGGFQPFFGIFVGFCIEGLCVCGIPVQIFFQILNPLLVMYHIPLHFKINIRHAIICNQNWNPVSLLIKTYRPIQCIRCDRLVHCCAWHSRINSLISAMIIIIIVCLVTVVPYKIKRL